MKPVLEIVEKGGLKDGITLAEIPGGTIFTGSASGSEGGIGLFVKSIEKGSVTAVHHPFYNSGAIWAANSTVFHNYKVVNKITVEV